MISIASKSTAFSKLSAYSTTTILSSCKMGTNIDLYCDDASSRCRSVHMTAKILGVSLNIIHVDLSKQETLKPSFVAINPAHTVPTMVEGDFVLFESAAISSYLVGKYGEGHSLYPKEPKRRALVDQFLHFDSGIRSKWNEYWKPIAQDGAQPSKGNLEKSYQSLVMLDKLLEGKIFAAGDKITLADLFLASTISNFVEYGLDLDRLKNIRDWYSRCQKQIPGFDQVNIPGAKMYANMLKSSIGQTEFPN